MGTGKGYEKVPTKTKPPMFLPSMIYRRTFHGDSKGGSPPDRTAGAAAG